MLLSPCWAMMAIVQSAGGSRGMRLTNATGATVARAVGNKASVCSPSRTMDSPIASTNNTTAVPTHSSEVPNG